MNVNSIQGHMGAHPRLPLSNFAVCMYCTIKLRGRAAKARSSTGDKRSRSGQDPLAT